VGTVSAGKSTNKVRVLPVCDGYVGLVQRMGHDGFLQTFLISKVVPTHSLEKFFVWTLLFGLEGTGARPSRVCCVSRGPGGSTLRADYDDTVVMGLESDHPEGEGFSWVHLSGLSYEESVWGRSSVGALTDAGVISFSHGLSVLPDVLVRFSLLDEIALATSTDDFLSKVLGRVQESDTGA
jgi:hypothetical protein